MIGKLWPDSNCWCWGASCLSHAIWMRWSFTRPRASQKASAGFRSTPSQVYIYIDISYHGYHIIRSDFPKQLTGEAARRSWRKTDGEGEKPREIWRDAYCMIWNYMRTLQTCKNRSRHRSTWFGSCRLQLQDSVAKQQNGIRFFSSLWNTVNYRRKRAAGARWERRGFHGMSLCSRFFLIRSCRPKMPTSLHIDWWCQGFKGRSPDIAAVTLLFKMVPIKKPW